MTRLLTVPALVLALGVPLAGGQDAEAPRWSPLGLHVEKPAPDGAAPSLSDISRGTRVIGLLHLKGKFIAGISARESKLEKFTDDRNTDLLQDPLKAQFTVSGLARDARPSADGSHCTVTFRAPGWPAPGASRVRVQGSVVVLVGKDEKEVEKKDVSLRLGIDLGVGTLEAEERFGRGATVRYRGSRPVKSVVFVNPDGKEVAHRQTTGSSVGLDGTKLQFSANFYLEGKVDRCTVRVRYFEAVEKVTVPLDLAAGVGL